MKSYYLKLNNNISLANIWIDGGTSLDKKRKDNCNTFILISDIGNAIIKDGISDEKLKTFLLSNGFK